MISVLNSVSQLGAENALSTTNASLQNTLLQLSTGLKINSGADDAAGLAIANGLGANIAALTQSSQNASNGIGLLQTADGALSQVTALLNRAVTLATEASTSGLSTSAKAGDPSQTAALDSEFQSIMSEITQIGATTNFNGTPVFGSTQNVFTSDGVTSGANALTTTVLPTIDNTIVGSGKDDLTSTGNAQTALTDVMAAISTVAAARGTIGASVNQLTATSNVVNTEVTNLTSAQNNIQNADIGKTVAKMTQYNVLDQTGMAALSQSNQAQQSVLKLLQ
jgi:flagellin